MSQFNLFVDEKGILQAKSRIKKNATVESGCKEPILLPSRHYYSELLIQEYHLKIFHNGVCDTLNAIRQKYLVLRGREAVKKLVRRCVICRKLEGIFFKPVSGHDLPESRVDDGPPFINTGVDFAGPLFISDRNNADKKVYICLFTCASTSAFRASRQIRRNIVFACTQTFDCTQGPPKDISQRQRQNVQICS